MTHILITGGAGFIGVNTAAYYAKKGDSVTIFDNFSRNGTRKNIAWLTNEYKSVCVVKGNIENKELVEKTIQGMDIVFHFAGQVAVTGSVKDPYSDFLINAMGTMHVLEGARKQKKPPIVIYSSTNKVYGGLEHLAIVEDVTRYRCPDRPRGIDESELLDFHSPYGCSKGAADQYVHDYARMYDIPTIVFRQSCIYGIHQMGMEDQGWVAWFLIAARAKKPITIYGNGKQVRDILWIDDLICAYDRAIGQISKTKGHIYNLGGGMENSISIWKEFGPIVEEVVGRSISPTYQTERPGDQPFFVANIEKAQKDFEWKPTVQYQQGITWLFEWLEREQ